MFKLPQLNPKVFYQIGKYCFFVTGLIGLIRILDLWNELKSYDVFSSLAGIAFNFTLAWFFASLQGKEEVSDASDEDIKHMNNALDKLMLGGKHGKEGTDRGEGTTEDTGNNSRGVTASKVRPALK